MSEGRQAAAGRERGRLPVLDGWRGISISLVLAAHLLPLGPKAWQLNETAGPMGMSLFFTLSGFLITDFLVRNSDVREFLIRRFFRIVPLAWLYIGLVLVAAGTLGWQAVPPHLFFYANWPPMALTGATSHLWSLCVEVQFYVAIALIVFLLRARGLLLIPLLCLLVTLYRVHDGMHIAIHTYYRVDEILAGGILALIFNGRIKVPGARDYRISPSFYLTLMALFVISCHPASGAANYLRPYLGALLVGSTLFDSHEGRLAAILKGRLLNYLAAISFALYVIHGGLRFTWLGSGDTLEKYLKRPLLFAATFALAHLSTFHYEKHWIAFGRRLAKRTAGIARPEAAR